MTCWPGTALAGAAAIETFALSGCTVCASTGEVLGPKRTSPPYVAVTGCDPTGRSAVSRVAVVTPAAVATGVLPSRTPPAVNDTEPVGADPDAGVTVAVKRTSCPNTDVGTVLVTPTAVAVAGRAADEAERVRVRVVGCRIRRARWRTSR